MDYHRTLSLYIITLFCVDVLYQFIFLCLYFIDYFMVFCVGGKLGKTGTLVKPGTPVSQYCTAVRQSNRVLLFLSTALAENDFSHRFLTILSKIIKKKIKYLISRRCLRCFPGYPVMPHPFQISGFMSLQDMQIGPE